MPVKVTVNSVQNEAVANSVIEAGDTLVINGVSYPVTSVTPGANSGLTDIMLNATVAPPVGATMYLKRANGAIPLGTANVPGLVTKRLRSYMETPNIATTPDGVTTWDVLDVDGVSAASLFGVGDWIKINGIEYLIQVATPAVNGVTLTTAPPGPMGAAQHTVYHYIESGTIPLATANTPGLVPKLINTPIICYGNSVMETGRNTIQVGANEGIFYNSSNTIFRFNGVGPSRLELLRVTLNNTSAVSPGFNFVLKKYPNPVSISSPDGGVSISAPFFGPNANASVLVNLLEGAYLDNSNPYLDVISIGALSSSIFFSLCFYYRLTGLE